MANPTRKLEISNINAETYWKRPASQPTGVENSDPIYTAVGRTLSSWENVEEAITNLFMTLSQPATDASYMTVGRAFGSMMSGAARRSATEAAADIFFKLNPSSPRGPFNQIIENTRKASVLRDDAAHGRVSEVSKDRYLLMPPSYNSTRTIASSKIDPLGFEFAEYRYNADDLNTIWPKFNVLANAIGDYIQFIRSPS